MQALQIFPSRPVAPAVFRIALFVAAASLAAYIAFKYATQLHAIAGLYAFLFPLSGFLALAGITLAVRPRTACDCSTGMRVGFGVLAGLWLATGLLCVPSLVEMTAASPAGGAFATFHMLVQHVFLTLCVLAFAIAPWKMARWSGIAAGAAARPDEKDREKRMAGKLPTLSRS